MINTHLLSYISIQFYVAFILLLSLVSALPFGLNTLILLHPMFYSKQTARKGGNQFVCKIKAETVSMGLGTTVAEH
jgi:hypothetical protein